MSGLQNDLIELVRRTGKYEPLLEAYDIVGKEAFMKLMFVFAGQVLRFPTVSEVKKLLGR